VSFVSAPTSLLSDDGCIILSMSAIIIILIE
jgi:hypothetical protein